MSHIPKSTKGRKAFLAGAGALTVFGSVIAPHVGSPLPVGDLTTLNSCGQEGSAKEGALQWSLNPFKNRWHLPQASDMVLQDQNVLDMMLHGPQNTEDIRAQFDQTKATSIDGYIVEVKQGGVESCNCGSQDAQFMDTHIYISEDPTITQKSRAVIVEVTPRIRQEMLGKADWSTANLTSLLKPGTPVHITGWLFYDQEHEGAAANTNPGGTHNWRATCWELHPVTDIETEEVNTSIGAGVPIQPGPPTELPNSGFANPASPSGGRIVNPGNSF